MTETPAPIEAGLRAWAGGDLDALEILLATDVSLRAVQPGRRLHRPGAGDGAAAPPAGRRAGLPGGRAPRGPAHVDGDHRRHSRPGRAGDGPAAPGSLLPTASSPRCSSTAPTPPRCNGLTGSGQPGAEPAQHRADHRLLVPAVAHHQAAPSAEPVADPSRLRRPRGVLAATCLLVQEVRATQAYRDLRMATEPDDTGLRAGPRAAPARDVPSLPASISAHHTSSHSALSRRSPVIVCPAHVVAEWPCPTLRVVGPTEVVGTRGIVWYEWSARSTAQSCRFTTRSGRAAIHRIAHRAVDRVNRASLRAVDQRWDVGRRPCSRWSASSSACFTPWTAARPARCRPRRRSAHRRPGGCLSTRLVGDPVAREEASQNLCDLLSMRDLERVAGSLDPDVLALG